MLYGTEQMFWILLSLKSIIGYYKNCWAINGVLVCGRMFINFILGEFYICYHFVRKGGKAKFGKWNLIIDSIKSIESFGCRTEVLNCRSAYGLRCVTIESLTTKMTVILLTCPTFRCFCFPLHLQIGYDSIMHPCHFFPSLSLRFQPTFSIDWVICQPPCVIASEKLHKLIHFWLLRFYVLLNSFRSLVWLLLSFPFDFHMKIYHSNWLDQTLYAESSDFASICVCIQLTLSTNFDCWVLSLVSEVQVAMYNCIHIGRQYSIYSLYIYV